MNPEILTVEFTHHTKQNKAYISYMPALSGDKPQITHVRFLRPVTSISYDQLVDLFQTATKAIASISPAQTVEVATVGNSKSVENLPVQKMNFMQSAAFVFKGGGGLDGMIERLSQIGELAKGEMTDEEKKATDNIFSNLKKFK